MRKPPITCLIPALFLSIPAFAGGETPQEEELRAEYQTMLEEAESARQGAQAAREEAMKVAEMARETARMEAEMAREEAELSRRESRSSRESAETSRARAEEAHREQAIRQEEMERIREELSKTHRELREATREVAKAHRELALTNNVRHRVRVVNLGDRAVIGLVMGEANSDGIEIIAVSPDGPAERAGLQQGDVMVSIHGEDLRTGKSASHTVRAVMADVEDGDELMIEVLRDNEPMELTVVAETREPTSWPTMVRIPEIEFVEGVPGEPKIVVETIEASEIDHEALQNHVTELTERLKAREFIYRHPGTGEVEWEGTFEFDTEDFSEFGGHAMSEANVWFGLPHSHGLDLAVVNAELGEYFKTDHGVLVIKAREDNAYGLESGDVILKVGAAAIESPSDMMRALRDLEPGEEIDIEIKRKRRDKTLTVVMPENRLGHVTTSVRH